MNVVYSFFGVFLILSLCFFAVTIWAYVVSRNHRERYAHLRDQVKIPPLRPRPQGIAVHRNGATTRYLARGKWGRGSYSRKK